MAIKARAFDVVDSLDTPQRVALYLAAAFEDGAPQRISAAIGDAARAYGMMKLAKRRTDS